MIRLQHLAAAFALAGLLVLPAGAQQVSDPIGDFETTYTDPPGADLDVVTTNVQFNNSSLIFTGTMNGAIGTTPGGVYVFGLNRGQGTARFLSIGKTGVLFDSVVIINGSGGGTARDLISGVAKTLTDVTITGRNFSASVLHMALPPRGFSVDQYTFNLWPRSGLTNNNQISDFAPDNSNARVTAVVPEPASRAAGAVRGLLLVGLLACARRRAARPR